MSDFTETLQNVIAWAVLISFLLVFIFSVFLILAKIVRTQREKSGAFKLTFLQIKLPPQNEVEIKAAEQMFSGLVGFKKPFFSALFSGQYRISFEVVSKASGIGFYVVVPDDLVSLVEKQVNGSYPDAEIDIVDPTEVWDRGSCTVVNEIKLAGPPYYPIKLYEEMGADSMSPLTSAMSKMGPEEVLAVQFVISPASGSWRKAGGAFIGSVKVRSADGRSHVDPEFMKGVEKKVSKPGFDAAIRLIAVSNDKISAQNHLRNLTTSFEQFTNVTYNRFRKRKFIFIMKLIDDFIYRRINVREFHLPFIDITLYRNCSVLNTEELATVFHLPNKNVQTPGIIWLSARRASAPTNLPTTGLYLGQSIFRGVKKKVYMTPEDRVRHTYIIGQTGTGKSQLMMSMILQDIQNGEGVAVIDPHGSDISDLLEKIPESRVDDVILFDAGDFERPMGLNMLEADSEEEKHMLINSFIGMLYKLYDPNKQGIMGPQLERAIRNVMLTAMVDPESTMVDVLRLLIDDKYAQSFIPKITDPLVKKYWTDEQAKTTASRKGEMMGYFVSKFDRLVTERVMRNIIGQPKSSFSFRKIMAEKKILLCDLSKGKIGEENSNFLGLLIVPRILSAALSRSTLMEQGIKFPHFYLYVDEFQNFATDDFATILSEARKYKLDLIVAHQFIPQLGDKVKEAVFGNVGTICAFRVGADDAKYLETHFEPIFKQTDLMNNPTGSYYTRLLVNNMPAKPFSVNVDWEMITNTKRDPEVARRIRENSRNKYGKSAKEVEEYITKRTTSGQEEPQPGAFGGGFGGFGARPSPFGGFGGFGARPSPFGTATQNSNMPRPFGSPQGMTTPPMAPPITPQPFKDQPTEDQKMVTDNTNNTSNAVPVLQNAFGIPSVPMNIPVKPDDSNGTIPDDKPTDTLDSDKDNLPSVQTDKTTVD